MRKESKKSLWLYIEGTNFNIWCARSQGQPKKTKLCVRSLLSCKEFSLNLFVSALVIGVSDYECHLRSTWSRFNDFLEGCPSKLWVNQRNIEAFFILDYLPIHRRVNTAHLEPGHSERYLSPFSHFFNSWAKNSSACSSSRSKPAQWNVEMIY